MMKTLTRALLALALAVPMAAYANPTLEEAIAQIDDYNDAAAMVIVRDLAERGDPRAQELMGFMLLFADTHYRTGQLADRAAGFAWLARAAGQGRAPAGAVLRSLAGSGDRDARAAVARADAGSSR